MAGPRKKMKFSYFYTKFCSSLTLWIVMLIMYANTLTTRLHKIPSSPLLYFRPGRTFMALIAPNIFGSSGTSFLILEVILSRVKHSIVA